MHTLTIYHGSGIDVLHHRISAVDVGTALIALVILFLLIFLFLVFLSVVIALFLNIVIVGFMRRIGHFFVIIVINFDYFGLARRGRLRRLGSLLFRMPADKTLSDLPP